MIFERRYTDFEPRVKGPDYPEYHSHEEPDEDEGIIDDEGEVVE